MGTNLYALGREYSISSESSGHLLFTRYELEWEVETGNSSANILLTNYLNSLSGTLSKIFNTSELLVGDALNQYTITSKITNAFD